MWGIIRKDIFESFKIKKNLWNNLFGFLLVILILVLMRSLYVYILTFMVTLPLVGCSMMQYSMEQDEISKFNEVLLTYPISKKEIILSKYLSNGVFSLITYLLSLPFVFTYIFLNIVTFSQAIVFWAAGLVISYIFLAATMVCFMWLGNKKGTIVYMILVVMFAIGYVFVYWQIDFSIILNLGLGFKFLIGILIAVGSLVLSFYGSLKIYTKRYS